jgi:phage shock protein PspC (stress-responsive transcriptional regulator)
VLKRALVVFLLDFALCLVFLLLFDDLKLTVMLFIILWFVLPKPDEPTDVL